MTANKFRSDLCRPAKKLEMWTASIKKKFGALAANSPFFARVSESLLSLHGLQRVLATIPENIPLHGTSGSNAGVEDTGSCLGRLLSFATCLEFQDAPLLSVKKTAPKMGVRAKRVFLPGGPQCCLGAHEAEAHAASRGGDGWLSFLCHDQRPFPFLFCREDIFLRQPDSQCVQHGRPNKREHLALRNGSV